MANIAFPKHSKTLKLPSSTTYTYLYIPAKASLPTLLFLHGFPSSSYDWRHQISSFSAHGYGVLAPDLLGYPGTDKPSAPSEYRGKKMASEIAEILDHEKLEKVHAISHDWGSYLLSRLANYYPERLSSLAFLEVPYMPPGEIMDLDAMNKTTKERMGFEAFGYWRFFEKEEAGNIVKEHFNSFFSLVYPDDAATWKQHLGPTGAMEAWLKSDRVGPMASYVTDEEKAMHRSIFKDDYGSAMNWYRSHIWNLNKEDEEKAKLDPNLPHPMLVVTASRVPIGSPQHAERIRGFAADVVVKELDAGHWIQLEKSGEVNEILKEFVDGIGTRG